MIVSILTWDVPRHNTVPTTPLRVFFTTIGGLDNFLIRTILIDTMFKSIAIPLNIKVLANNITEKCFWSIFGYIDISFFHVIRLTGFFRLEHFDYLSREHYFDGTAILKWYISNKSWILNKILHLTKVFLPNLGSIKMNQWLASSKQDKELQLWLYIHAIAFQDWIYIRYQDTLLYNRHTSFCLALQMLTQYSILLD